MKHALWILLLPLLVLTACGGNIVLNAQDYYLEIVAPAEGESELQVTIVNVSGKTAEILLIPTLEKKNSDGQWEVVEVDDGIGFCGTPDPLPAGELHMPVKLDHIWSSLCAGDYRLSYMITDSLKCKHTAAGEFTLTHDIVLPTRS